MGKYHKGIRIEGAEEFLLAVNITGHGAPTEDTEAEPGMCYLDEDSENGDLYKCIGMLVTETRTVYRWKKLAGQEEVERLSEAIGDLNIVDENDVHQIVKKYLEENTKDMATLTINGQQYNGSEDVVVEIAGAESSGGNNEIAQETQLGTGTVATGTEAQTLIDTGISLETLKKYKRFVFVFKGASNTALANTYLTFKNIISYAIYRSDNVGGMVCGFEWLNAEIGLMRVYSLYQGNPSLVKNIGSNYIVTTVNGILSSGGVGGGSNILFDLSDLEDSDTLKIYISNTTTIDYAWEIRGLTV